MSPQSACVLLWYLVTTDDGSEQLVKTSSKLLCVKWDAVHNMRRSKLLIKHVALCLLGLFVLLQTAM